MMCGPIISIIIPVYNTIDYLERCINSIINQSYKKWELILVDDGSNDGSQNLCDLYSGKDDRIRTIHQPNGGVSSARNLGLKNALGKWITFIDSDDYIDKDFLHDLIYYSEHVDLVVSGYKLINNNNVISKGYVIGEYDLEGSFLAQGRVWCSSVCFKLINRNIITKYNLHFDENVFIAEDLLFMVQYLNHINKIIFTDSLGYN